MKHLLFLMAFSISLLANSQIVPPYQQTFDGITIPGGWSQADNTDPITGQIWEFGTVNWGAHSPVLSGNYAVLNSDGYGDGGGQNADLISPTFDFTGIISVHLQFKHFFYQFLESSATLSYSIDDGNSWTAIKTWTRSTSNPESFNQVIDAVAGESQVKFKWNYTGNYEWGWSIDDVIVTETNTATWDGSESTNWNEAGNWDINAVPGADTKVIIPVSGNNPVIGDNVTCYDLTIDNGAVLTISSQKSLTVFGVLTNNALVGIKILSDATGTGSLIAASVAGAGTAEVQRYMKGNQWHNISSPVEQTVASFLANNANVPVNGASRGMTDYNTASDAWNAYFTDANAADLESAKGFLLRNNADGNVAFTGKINGGEKITPLSPSGNGWNLIGNPYPSAICINDDSGLDNFLSYNGSSIDINYFGIYVWNGTEYEIINHASGAEYASIGQGFFVKNTDGTTADFTSETQVHQPSVALKSGVLIPEIKLTATSSKKSTSTKIKFFKDATTGLDKGFDAGILKSDATFSVFTRLVNDNNIEFGLQCLPLKSAEMMIIPIGIDFTAGGEVTFSAQLFNVSSEKNIILEDRLLNTFTSLNDTKSAYTANLVANSKGTGRFYLHLYEAQTTGIDNNGLAKINAWMEKNEIVIQGVTENNAIASLYDVRGSLIMKRNLQNTITNRINLNGIKNGIYMLQVVENGKRTGVKLQISGN
jgi:hypothetical protein